MTKIYEAATTEAILTAISAVLMSNNGYADIGTNDEVAAAVSTAGFVVITTKDLHGNAVNRAFTKAAQTALAASPFGVSTYRPITPRVEEPDYEAAILSRQEAAFDY